MTKASAMSEVIASIIAESLEHHQQRKRELLAVALTNAHGHVKTSIVAGHAYIRLRRYVAGKVIDEHLARADSPLVDGVKRSIAIRKEALGRIGDVFDALRLLGMRKKDIMHEDFTPTIMGMFDEFERLGLWDEALTLIGSWCFKVYQSQCGVEHYPERTLDVDFAVKIPHHGREANIALALKSLGFAEEHNYATGDTRFVSHELKVEFLKDRRGSGKRRAESSDFEPSLGIAPVALPYLRLLLDNRVTLALRGAGKVVVPAMPAFVLHKLLVAPRRREEAKRFKDYRQAETVAKVVMRDEALVDQAVQIAASMHKKWLAAVLRAVKDGPEEALKTGAVRALAARLA